MILGMLRPKLVGNRFAKRGVRSILKLEADAPPGTKIPHVAKIPIDAEA